jgi:hypothetical protein
MLKKGGFDVLLVLDCYYTTRAITKGMTGMMEVLASCSQEVKAVVPGGGSIIGSPFTNPMIKHLEESTIRSYGLLMIELQVLPSLDRFLENQSPNYVVLSGYDNPINLRPICSREL